jgi:hypothetical protein
MAFPFEKAVLFPLILGMKISSSSSLLLLHHMQGIIDDLLIGHHYNVLVSSTLISTSEVLVKFPLYS